MNRKNDDVRFFRKITLFLQFTVKCLIFLWNTEMWFRWFFKIIFKRMFPLETGWAALTFGIY